MIRILFCSIYILTCSRLFSHAQLLEKNTYSFSNIDTAALMQRIDATQEIARLYPDSALSIYLETRMLAKAQKFDKGVILSNVRIGNILVEKGSYFKSLQYYKDGLPYCYGNNAFFKALIYNNIANVYIYLTRYETAVQTYLKAAKYANQYRRNGAFPVERIYGNLSEAFTKLRQNNKALYYLDTLKKISINTDDHELLANTLVREANIYKWLDASRSGQLYDSAIALARTHNLQEVLFDALANSGNLYIETGKLNKAFECLFEAYSIVNNSKYKKTGVSLLLGKAYTLKPNYDSAGYWLSMAGKQSGNLPYKQAEVFKYYAELYETKGDNAKAIRYFKSFMRLKDSIDNNERASRIVDIETQYRTAEKDKEIAEQQLKITRQQASLKQSRLFTIAGIIISTLLIILLLITRRSIKHRQKRMEQEAETKILKTALDSEQKERNRIAMELHDGIVSDLTAIKLNLEITQPTPDQKDSYHTSVKQLGVAIHDIRNTAHNLMPEILLRHHIEDAIRMLCTTIERTGRLKIRFLSFGDLTQIKMEIRQSVYRIVQELLLNIIKHAGAREALVQISCYETLFTATIEDNGTGMVHKNKNQKEGIGIKNIEERILKLNGRIAYGASSFGKGLSVYIEIDI